MEDELEQGANTVDIMQFLDILTEEAMRLRLSRTAAALQSALSTCEIESLWRERPAGHGGLGLSASGPVVRAPLSLPLPEPARPQRLRLPHACRQRRRGSARAGSARR